ncbi:DUF805 domain-containing protein [Acidisphaera sp. L21]|uniref:DUF805 domain-containing protein n=1 Tax=Acidisphaera sp. L21 TaxID=1641851 RepID=UPI00131D759B|nr:DUF805 domain-containing protein [Acidisphaera sp. L21]
MDVVALDSDILSSLMSLRTIVPNLALGIKRCQDRDHAGWFLLIGLIPLVGAVWLGGELGFLRGMEGTNRFGPDPPNNTDGGFRPAHGPI